MRHAPVSVVVPMRDEAGAVAALLEGLSRQEIQPREIIFVDTGSLDGSAERVRDWWAASGWEGTSCRVIVEPGAYPGGGRNAGIRASAEPWIALIDCGIVPAPGWLAGLLAHAERSGANAVLGMCCFEAEGAWATAVCALSYGVGTRRPALPASLFRRTLFDRVGYFDPTLRAGEDLLWLKALARAGEVAEVCGGAEVIYGRFPNSPSLAVRKWFEYEWHVSAGGIGGWRRRVAVVAPLLLYALLAVSLALGFAVWLAYIALRSFLDPMRRSTRRTWWRGEPLALACAPVAAVAMDLARALGCIFGLASHSRRAGGAVAVPVAGSIVRDGLVLWVLYFCYATSIALMFQKVILPLMPSMHAGFGLLDGDSIFFHNIAVDLAARIREQGWGEWSIYPAVGATGNVSILAALYAVFGADPSLIVPINAAMHAFSGVLLCLIGRQLMPGAAGTLGGLVAGTLFVVFPSALNWYGQLHKDGYAIAGVLLIVWAWLRVQGRRPLARDFWITVGATFGAMLLIALVRPYNLTPLAAVMLAALGLLFLLHWASQRTHLAVLAVCAISVALIAAGANIAKKLGVDERYALDPGQALDVGSWRWYTDDRFPKFTEDFVESAARTRARFMQAGSKAGAGSMIDLDRRPESTMEVAVYFPRALQVALFAPFPDRWLEKKSLPHLVAMLETLAWYLIAPGVLLCLLYASPTRSLLVLAVVLLFLIIYGVTVPNVGTLYRIRSPFLFLLIAMGAVGWLEFLRRHTPAWIGSLRFQPAPAVVVPEAGDFAWAGRANVLGAGAGAVVGALTALTFVGLFARDAILARWFGTGSELDAYFVAIAVPSFLIAAISIPLGTVLTAQFLEARHQRSEHAAQALVSRIGGLYATAMVLIVAALALAARPLLGLVGSELAPDTAALARVLFYWMLPILALSGFVIIGNAILNALGAYALPASAQLVVPAISIAAILLAGPRDGVVAAIGGMLAGQVLNLWIVARALARRGISVAPRWGVREPLRDLPVQYLAVVAAALLTNLAAPVNLGMASTLESGAATWGLGSKVMTFVAGIIAAAMTTVILPRFAAIMARRRLIDLREELSFLLLAATALTIPMALLLFAGAEILVRVAFAGGVFGEDSVEAVARVMRFGIVQLPFLTVSLLILKFAIAARAAGWVFVASLIALCLNVALNLVLMRTSGVAGIALASTVAVALSTFFMLLLFRRLGHVTWMDVLMLTLNWMPYTTFVICLHYRSYAGAVVSMLAMVVLFAGHLGTLSRGSHAARA